jgi:hypothetical protein
LQTDTQYEDATIAKDFSFKLVNAYFACFFVAFVQNNFQIFGVDMHCPSWHCMPELTGIGWRVEGTGLGLRVF